MSRRETSCLTALVTALGLAACGGSSQPSSSSTAPAPASSSSTTASSSTSTATATATATAQGTSTRPPEVPATQPTKTTGGAGAPAGGASNVHVRASFTIHGTALTPHSLTVPAFVAVGLTIAAGDGRGHRVVLGTPSRVEVSVPARGRVTVKLPGARAGSYPVTVDGRPGGVLLVGGEVGP